MKTFASASALAFVAAASWSSGVEGRLNCVNYEPFSNYLYNSNIDAALNNDLGAIARQGFKCIKSYYSQHFGRNVAQFAKNYGLQVVLGVWMEEGAFIEAEISNAIHSCKNHDNVIALSIGVENLPRRNAWDILNIKNRLRAAGCVKPIGTSQMLSYYLNKNGVAWNLIHELDFLGYNVYPFFTPLNSPNQAVEALKNQIGQLRNAYPDIFDSKFRITETGWPTDGGNSPQGNAANWWNAKNYADGFASMLCSGQINTPWVAYFIFFDPSYKTWAVPFERSFGLAYANGNPKWDIRNLNCNGFVEDRVDSPSVQKCADNTQFIEGTDFYGNDIRSVRAGSHMDCCGHCSSTQGCNTWVWTRYNGGTCFLKNAASNRRALSGEAGAVAWTSTGGDSPSGGTSELLTYNTNILGNDVANVRRNNAAECFDACYANAQCGSFTWSNYQGGTCWLKSGGGSTTERKAGDISGVKCGLRQDVDIPGNDIGNAKSTTASGCCSLCASKTGCKAFTWSGFNGGTCWLKSSGNGAVTGRPGLFSFS